MDTDIVQFVKKHNETNRNPQFKSNIGIVKLYIQHNNKLKRPLSIDKHRKDFIDWINENQEIVQKSDGKSGTYGEFYLFPYQIKVANWNELPSHQKTKFVVLDSAEKIIEESIPDFPHIWKKITKNDDIWYREKKKKKYVYKAQLIDAFINIPLPKRGQGIVITKANEKKIWDYIKEYGYPFENESLKELNTETDFMSYFLYKWIRVYDLIHLSHASPSFPKISGREIKIDGYKLPSTHYSDLLSDANKSRKQNEGDPNNAQKYLYDYYSSIYGLILNAIIDSKQKWKKCEYAGCDKYFLPLGKKKRGCCPLHQNRIRAKLHRNKK